MTVKELYEWAKANKVEDCTIKINMGSYGEIYYFTPEIKTKEVYDRTEYKEVVL